MTQKHGALLLAAGLALAGAASAEEVSPAQAPLAHDEEVLSLEEMEGLSGGDGVDVNVITAQTLTAINSGNSVTGQTVGSGQINIANGGLSNFEGVGNFVMNTGHNNNLQSTLNVNIVLAP